MIALLRRRPHFRDLWLGETASLIGDWLSYVAISLLALDAGGGALALAVVFAAHSLPTAFVSPLAGVIADRVDRRSMLVGTQLAQAAIMAAMVLAAAFEAIVAVQLLLVLRTVVAGFFYPAKQAALRRLVEDDELLEANAIDAATWSVTFAAGTALGGVLALAGPVVALAVDMLTFIVAAWWLARLPSIAPEEASTTQLRSATAIAADLAQALRRAAPDRALMEAVFAKTPMALAGGAAWVLLNLTAYETRLLGSSALALGLMQAIRGVGTGVGPMMARRLFAGRLGSLWPMRASLLLVPLAIAAFAVATGVPAPWAWLPLLSTVLVWGIASGSTWVFSSAAIQRLAPEGTLGRLSSVDQLSFTAAMSLAALAGGVLVEATQRASHAGWLGVAMGLGAYAALRLATAPAPAPATP